MKSKTFIVLAIVVPVVVGALFFLRNDGNAPSQTGGSAGLIVGTNAIYVADQLPGQSVSIADLRLASPGFVLIFDDNAGKPKNILGTSGSLPIGETKNIAPILLSRITRDGEVLYAMLYLDDGDGVFDPARDKPAHDRLIGQPVVMMFTINLDASEGGAVNP